MLKILDNPYLTSSERKAELKMRATLQFEGIKILLKSQYGVPEGVIDQVDNLLRLSYKEGYDDASEDLAETQEEDK